MSDNLTNRPLARQSGKSMMLMLIIVAVVSAAGGAGVVLFFPKKHATEGHEAKKPETIRNVGQKVGRNDPCPCGSGKKYKNCHMKIEAGK